MKLVRYGRAGRFKNNGTFSYTKEAGTLDPKIIETIENHNFDQIQKIYWRNSNLDFNSVEKFLSSLKEFPVQSYFIHKKNAIDELNFRNLIDDNEVKSFLLSSNHIRILWDVCRIPDFEKIFNDNYLSFLKHTFLILVKNKYKIPEEWIEKQL